LPAHYRSQRQIFVLRRKTDRKPSSWLSVHRRSQSIIQQKGVFSKYVDVAIYLSSYSVCLGCQM
jgi:hypothetical protein